MRRGSLDHQIWWGTYFEKYCGSNSALHHGRKGFRLSFCIIFTSKSDNGGPWFSSCWGPHRVARPHEETGDPRCMCPSRTNSPLKPFLIEKNSSRRKAPPSPVPWSRVESGPTACLKLSLHSQVWLQVSLELYFAPISGEWLFVSPAIRYLRIVTDCM